MTKEWIQKILAGPAAPKEDMDGFPIPWEKDRVSIYRFLSALGTTPLQALPEAANELPDEEIFNNRTGSQLRWAAGARDGVLGHHASGGEHADVVAMQDALLSAATKATTNQLETLYNMLVADNALRFIDPLLQNIRDTAHLPIDRLRALARWLATESPDRGAVKFGIALLGLFVPAEDTDTLVTLGIHEEFTLYAVVALGNTLDANEVEAAWWAIAKRVHGWGRIHIVERLIDTQRDDIRFWLLREGYENSVMYEYLAYSCALGGNLLGALQAEKIDDGLLAGAAEILTALINGGPAEDIYSYKDGSRVVPLYLCTAAKARTRDLKVLVAVDRIQDLVTDDDIEWERLEALGWTAEVREQLVTACERFIAFEYWREVVEDAWSTNDNLTFWTAARAGEVIGLDVWKERFERQKTKLSDQWYFLMQTDDPARIHLVIDLLVAQFDLAAIATRPAGAMAFGPDHEIYSAFDSVLQDLGRFPGIGFHLIKTGLRSPVIRDRNMAIRALKEWGVANWPSGTREMLQRTFDDEPYPDTRKFLAEALALS